MDDIDEKLTENRSWQNETYDYDNEKDGEDDEEEEHNKGANANGDSGSVHPVLLKRNRHILKKLKILKEMNYSNRYKCQIRCFIKLG